MTAGRPSGREGTGSHERVEIVVRGRVQAVGFRMFVSRAAAVRGLVGWVANGSDGSVRSVAEGSRADLEAFVGELAKGPTGAVVDRIETSWSPATGTFDRFGLRSGWHGGD